MPAARTAPPAREGSGPTRAVPRRIATAHADRAATGHPDRAQIVHRAGPARRAVDGRRFDRTARARVRRGSRSIVLPTGRSHADEDRVFAVDLTDLDLTALIPARRRPVGDLPRGVPGLHPGRRIRVATPRRIGAPASNAAQCPAAAQGRSADRGRHSIVARTPARQDRSALVTRVLRRVLPAAGAHPRELVRSFTGRPSPTQNSLPRARS